MADPPPTRRAADDMGVAHDASAPRTPRWVKAFAIIAMVLVALVVVMLLVGAGNHGPGRHFGSSTPPASATGGHTPPVDGPA